jgi:hypothetical protein
LIVPYSGFDTGIVTLEANGDIVLGFSVQRDRQVHDISLQDNGQILMAGDFEEVNGQATQGVARLNPDGSIDSDFPTGITIDNRSEVVMERKSGRILLGGTWSTFNGQSESILLQLTGNLKASWAASQGGNQLIDIPIVDDLVYEGDEQFQLQLASVGEGSVEIGAADTSTVTITDNDPYLDQPITNRSATEGQLFNLNVSANFVHPEGALLSFSATGLPGSISISSDGVISGTPASSDSLSSPYSVEVTVTDPAGATASGTFSLTIIDPPTQKSSGGGSIDLIFLLALSLLLLAQLFRERLGRI